MRLSKRTPPLARAGTGITTTAMASNLMAAPYMHWGKGRPWPLLTGERGHYELAAGHDCRPLLHAMEQFSNGTCLLPEQIWDEADLPEAHLRCGGPTGSANPLLWAHSEYLRLLRSCHDGKYSI